MPLSGGTLNRENFETASRRAAQEPLAFNPNERSAYVKSMIELTLEHKRRGLTIPEIKEKVAEFAEKYENLFEMITSPSGYDKKNLDIMLTMLDHMGKGNLTQHDASVIVGKRLYEKYGGGPK